VYRLLETTPTRPPRLASLPGTRAFRGVTTLRAALASTLPTLPLRGVARVSPLPPFAGRSCHRVALRFAPSAEGEQGERAAVRAAVEELRAVLVAGVEADGAGAGGWWFLRVVGAG
jgi:hypothetical protein